MRKLFIIIMLMNLLLPSVLVVPAQETTTFNTGVPSNFKQPIEILDVFSEHPEKFSATLNILNANEANSYDVNTRAYIRDGKYYYFVTSAPGQISSSALMEINGTNYQQSYILVEDLAKYSAEALNLYPNDFVGTAIEQFYIYAQENPDKIQDVYIQNDALNEQYEQLLSDTKMVDDFFIQVFKQLLNESSIEPTIEEIENAGQIYSYAIDANVAQQLAEIAKPLVGDNEVLMPYFKMFEQGYIGTLGFSMGSGDMALSIASPNGAEVLEYVIGLETVTINEPNADKILTVEEFTRITGIDLFGYQESTEE